MNGDGQRVLEREVEAEKGEMEAAADCLRHVHEESHQALLHAVPRDGRAASGTPGGPRTRRTRRDAVSCLGADQTIAPRERAAPCRREDCRFCYDRTVAAPREIQGNEIVN